MTLEQIRSLLEKLGSVTDCSLQLMRFKNSASNTSTYCCRNITLKPDGKLVEVIERISSVYTGTSKKKLNDYRAVEDYNGTTDSQVIYKLKIDDDIIADEYTALVDSISTPDNEVDPFALKANAYVICGNISNIQNGELITRPIKLISMQNPITSLKNKFWGANGEFKEITESVLNLRSVFDILIYDDTIYMFTLAGEKLFNMERAYKMVCEKKMLEVVEFDFVTDGDSFYNTASRGHNPRRFISFNQSRFEHLKDISNRIRMADKFAIPLDDNKFDTTQEGAADKLIRLLCNKGMIDPFEDIPVEVPNAKKWS